MSALADLIESVGGLITAVGGLVLLAISLRRQSRRERQGSADRTVDELLKLMSADPRVVEALRERLEDDERPE